MLHVDYNVKGTSQNPGTWQNFLEIRDARWWWRLKSECAKSWWFVVCSFCDVVRVKSVANEMQHISKTSMEICDARWWVKSKSTIHVRKMWYVCNPCFVFICRVTPPQQLSGFWFLRYVYSFGEVCHRRNSTYLKTVLRQVVVDMAGPGFHIHAKLPFEIYGVCWLQCEGNISKSSHVT